MSEGRDLLSAGEQSIVAGQVWKRPGVFATVTDLRIDPDAPEGMLPRILATVVEIGAEDCWIRTRQLSCAELRADHVLIFDATLKDPFNVQ